MADEIKYLGSTDLLYIAQMINTELQKYVKAVTGKKLSSEDFTSELKDKLSAIDMSKYSTTEQMTSAINIAVSNVIGLQIVKPEGNTLPATGELGKIYLIQNGGENPNIYDEYFWDIDNSKFELFGTTSVDLSGYLKSSELVELSKDECQAVWNTVFPET